MSIRGIPACGRRAFEPGNPSKTVGYCYRPRGHAGHCDDVAHPGDTQLDDGEGPCPSCGAPGEGYGCACSWKVSKSSGGQP